ncbi:MFS transporter [Paenibacillus agilis]|nr:MFS transporter [Paenibacillus agilis]
MFAFLKPKIASAKVPADQVEKRYKQLRLQSLLGVFFGYMAYYIVRNNFKLSTPHLQKELELSNTEIGILLSCLLITYGISKGIMSSLADKASPKRYMALGLALCAMVNIMLGFSTGFWVFAGLTVLLGLFQGMGVGPSFITLANWYPRKERGFITALWNISHNIGGGIVGPIVTFSLLMLGGDEHWQVASYQIPAAIAVVFVLVILYFTKEKPENEGLPTVTEMYKDNLDSALAKQDVKPPSDLTAWQILYHYVLKNKNAWLVSLADVFVYMIRFGVIAWLPIYLSNVKGFSKGEMGIAFLIFEWAAIPSTLLVGYMTDRFFKGYRMPPAIICMFIIFFGIIGYWLSDSLIMVTVFAGVIGALIYVPQFLCSLQTLEVVPPFAVGSAVGLRGILSYLLGASLGTTLFGLFVDLWGWNSGFYLLLVATVLCIIFCYWLHVSVKAVQKKAEQALTL